MSIDEKDIEGVLDSNGNVRGFQVLQAALAFSVVAFGIVVAVMYTSGFGGGNADGTFEIENTLSVTNCVMAAACWAAALGLFNAACRSAAVASIVAGTIAVHGMPDNAASRLFGRLRGAWISRMVLLEGSALFGLVVCLLATMDGTMRKQPLYWLNAAPALLLLVFAAVTFPTPDRLLGLLRDLANEDR